MWTAALGRVPGAPEPALSAVEGFRVAEGELTWVDEQFKLFGWFKKSPSPRLAPPNQRSETADIIVIGREPGAPGEGQTSIGKFEVAHYPGLSALFRSGRPHATILR